MLTAINPGQYLTITNTTGGTYYNTNHTAPLSGQMRYHSGGKIEVFDGSMWHQIYNQPTIALNEEVINVINWVKKKIEEEQTLLTLPSDHPAVKAAKERLTLAKAEMKQAEEQLKITMILSENE